jgi:hypothetical protein
MENKALNPLNTGKVRKLTTLMAKAIEKSGDVFTANEMLAALDVMRQSVEGIAKQAVNG